VFGNKSLEKYAHFLPLQSHRTVAFSLPLGISNTSQRMNNPIFLALFFILHFKLYSYSPIPPHYSSFKYFPKNFLASSSLFINAALPKEKYFTISIHCSNG